MSRASAMTALQRGTCTLVLAFVCVRARADAPIPDAQELRAARERLAALYERRDPRKALGVWRVLQTQHPGHLPYLERVADLAFDLAQRSDPPEAALLAIALDAARVLAARQPASYEAQVRLADMLLVRTQTASQLLPLLEQLVRRFGGRVRLREQLLAAYEAARRPRDALRVLDSLLLERHAASKAIEYRIMRSQLLASLADPAGQLRELESLRRAHPQQVRPRTELVSLHLAEGRFDAALAEIRELTRLPLTRGERQLVARRLRELIARRSSGQKRAQREASFADRYTDWQSDTQQRREDF